MSLEDGNDLLPVIFGDKFKDDLRIDEMLQNYVSKLGGFAVNELHRESGRLREEQSSIEAQTHDVVVNNYKLFIDTADCSRQLYTQFETIERDVQSLIVDLPRFEEACRKFAVDTSGINSLRKLNTLTITRNSQLLEVLELPQLMDNFINDGLYADALELSCYVRKLYARHSDIPIFQSIVEDINRLWLAMLHKMLAELQTDISLAKCLQVVGYIRRMDTFQEAELRVKFLQARDLWLKSTLDAITKEDVNHYLSKLVEVMRANMFSIITQYRAVFNDDEHSPLVDASNRNTYTIVIFFSWIRNKVNEFLRLLESELANCDILSNESVLEQCMYFGLSFSNVGIDFRSMLTPIFCHAIGRNFEAHIARATYAFRRCMDHYTLINYSHSHISSPDTIRQLDKMDPHQPPKSLLQFYPLAEYLNQVLIAFNALRLCAPLPVVHVVSSSIEQSLTTLANCIVQLYAAEQQAFTQQARDAFTSMCLCFVDDMLPYIQHSLHVIYPVALVASHVGYSVQALQRERITYLDRDKIVAPLSHLLPTKIALKILAENTRSTNRSDNGNRIGNYFSQTELPVDNP